MALHSKNSSVMQLFFRIIWLKEHLVDEYLYVFTISQSYFLLQREYSDNFLRGCTGTPVWQLPTCSAEIYLFYFQVLFIKLGTVCGTSWDTWSYCKRQVKDLTLVTYGDLHQSKSIWERNWAPVAFALSSLAKVLQCFPFVSFLSLISVHLNQFWRVLPRSFSKPSYQ